MNEKTEALYEFIRSNQDFFDNPEMTINGLKKKRETGDCKYFCALDAFVNFGCNRLQEEEGLLRQFKLEILMELIPMVTTGFDLKDFNPLLKNFKKKAEVIEFFSKINPDDVESFLAIFPYIWIIQPQLLTFVKNPLVLYNKCKSKLLCILRGLFEASNRSVLLSVLQLVISLRLAADVFPNLEEELRNESMKIEMIITTVFGFNTFDDPINVMSLILPDFPKLGLASLKHNYAANILNDSEFLGLCLDYDIKTPFGCAAILERVTALFRGFSNCEYYADKQIGYIYMAMMLSRSSPLQMMILEGTSKAIILFLVAYVSLQQYDYSETVSSSYGYSGTSASENSLIVITVFALAYECGQIFDSYKFTRSFVESLEIHFSDIWNRLDLSGNLFIFLWAFLLTSPASHDQGRIVLALSAIPLSLSLFQYLSVSKRLGSLIIMIFAMMGDLVTFLIVFLVAVMGFGIALWSLLRYDPTNEYSDSGQTMMTLFSAMLGGVDYSPFPLLDDVQSAWGFNDTSTIGDWYTYQVRSTGIAVYIVFVTIVGILLINLLIARMASTHDRIDADAKAEWAFLLASYTKSASNIYEKGPLTMLPAPLNMVTLAVYPVDLWLKYKAGKDKLMILSVGGTVADVLCRLTLFPVRSFYSFVKAIQMALNQVLSEWRAEKKIVHLKRSKTKAGGQLDVDDDTESISAKRAWELFVWFLYLCSLLLGYSIFLIIWLMFVDLQVTLIPRDQFVSYVKLDTQVSDADDEPMLIRYVDGNIYQPPPPPPPVAAASSSNGAEGTGEPGGADEDSALRHSLMHPEKIPPQAPGIELSSIHPNNVTSPMGPGGSIDGANLSGQQHQQQQQQQAGCDEPPPPREKTVPLNRVGQTMSPGIGEGTDNYYCGSTGESGEVCGPLIGPQCAACRGFTSTRNKKYRVIELAGLNVWESCEHSADDVCTSRLPAGTVVETDVKITTTPESGDSSTRVRIDDGRGWLILHFSFLQDVTDEVESPLWTDRDLKVIRSLLSSYEAATGDEDEDGYERIERTFDMKFDILNQRVDALDSKLQDIFDAIQSLKK